MRKRKDGVLPVTDERMTRFSLTLADGVEFVLRCLQWMRGGEIFVPKLPSYRILDLAKAIAPEARIEVTGIRPGEKLHETLVPADESWHTLEYSDRFVIHSPGQWVEKRATVPPGVRPCPQGFSYSSDNNSEWLSVPQLAALVAPYANRE
jgi:UDP-N-acetylglucosamine 4,6-dehydratase